MRNRHGKNRRLILLTMLLVVLLAQAFLYFDAKKDTLISNFLITIETVVSKNTGLIVKIGDIEGGFARDIGIRDIRVSKVSNNKLENILEIKTLTFNYKIWDIFLKNYDVLSHIEIDGPRLYLVKDLQDSFYKQNFDKLDLAKIFLTKFPEYILWHKPLGIFVSDGAILNSEGKYVLNNLNGNIIFDNKDIILDKVKGRFFDTETILSGRIRNVFFGPELTMSGLIKNNDFNGFIDIAGDTRSILVSGNTVIFNDLLTKFDVEYFIDNQFLNIYNVDIDSKRLLSGQFDLKELVSNFDIKLFEGDIDLAVDFSGFPEVFYDARIDHCKVGNFDFVTRVFCSSNIERDISIKLASDELIVNYKPYGKLTGEAIINKDRFEVKNLDLTDEFSFSGFIDNKKPYNGQLAFSINKLDLVKFLQLFPASERAGITGILNAKFEIKGNLKENISKGRIEVNSGTIGNVDFEKMTTSLTGRDSILKIEDSRIKVKNGYLLLSGFLDTNKIGKSSFLENLQVTTDNNTIVFDGWDIAKRNEKDEVSLSKQVGKDFDINLKTWTRRDNDNENPETKRSEVEFKYKVKSEDNLIMKLKGQNEEFIGMEHKVKF